MRETFRGAWVIARRDFAATVLTKSFLLFLLAPLFPILVGLVFGGLTVSAANRQSEARVVAVVAERNEFDRLSEARDRVAEAFRDRAVVKLQHALPAADPAAQRQRLLAGRDEPVLAVLEGGLDGPRLVSTLPPPDAVYRQLQLIVDQARASETSTGLPIARSVAQCPAGPLGQLAPQRQITAQAGQGVLFVLTILLATMLLSQLIEEKSNKIIEVLAAAVPVGAIFLGKLVAMLAVSLVGIAVWGSAGAIAIASFAQGGLAAIPAPAVGWPLFIALGALYFATSYLLLGAVFLGIGGHASTAREVQTLSMPVTMAQVAIFALAAVGVGRPDSAEAIAAAVFPLSSPFAMIGRAAEEPALWPHLLALAWQALWVALILRFAARLFRRSVLKSGPAVRWPWQRKIA